MEEKTITSTTNAMLKVKIIFEGAAIKINACAEVIQTLKGLIGTKKGNKPIIMGSNDTVNAFFVVVPNRIAAMMVEE